MGLNISTKDRWKWVLNKVEFKLTKWQNRKLNLAGRRMILNHYIVPMIIYYLSCWTPSNKELKEIIALCRNFLWGGDPWIKEVAKAKWEYCTLTLRKGT